METSSLEQHHQRILQAADYLRRQMQVQPDIAIVCGTGLSDSLHFMQMVQTIAFDNIPHFPQPTAPTHTGRLQVGHCGRRHVLGMQGRLHLYEGHTPWQTTFSIRVLQYLGVGCLIVINASGGINPNWQAGDIALIDDHINLSGANPLAGPNHPEWGPRFVDMALAYAPRLKSAALSAGKQCGVDLCQGVYAGLAGPSLETPAEIRFLQRSGADMVGFSTVGEVIVARQAGMQVLGLSIVTNVHRPDAPEPADIDAIIATAAARAPEVSRLLEQLIRILPVEGVKGDHA